MLPTDFLEGILAGGSAGLTLDPGEPSEVHSGWRIEEATACPGDSVCGRSQESGTTNLWSREASYNTTQASSHPAAPYDYPSGMRDH